jgi:hypothetical protein
MYHYHVEPYALTTANGKNSLIGYLLDGFPVYGPLENGVTITTLSGMLDTYHGHIHATADYPGGIYHYHITADAPYINGTGFYGTAGTVTYTLSASPTPTATSAAATPTATNTAAPASVGGIAEDPGTVQTHAEETAPAQSNTAKVAVIAGAAVAAITICGNWFTLRRKRGRQAE